MIKNLDNFGRFGGVVVVSIICLVLLLFDIIAGFCLCYHPEREDEKYNYLNAEYRTVA